MEDVLIECSPGISGDMLLGAFYDLGVPKKVIEQPLNELGLKDLYHLDFKESKSCSIRGIKAKVENVDCNSVKRTWKSIKELILNGNLEDKLKEYRKNKASIEGCKLYQVFPNKTIDALLNIRIKSINDLRKIEGLGEKRIEKYGNNLMDILNDNPLEETKEQNVVDKLLNAGLSLDDIKLLKNEIVL